MGKIFRSYSDKYFENEIIKIIFNIGECVECGDSVDVVILKGFEKVKMLNVIGLFKEEVL